MRYRCANCNKENIHSNVIPGSKRRCDYCQKDYIPLELEKNINLSQCINCSSIVHWYDTTPINCAECNKKFVRHKHKINMLSQYLKTIQEFVNEKDVLEIVGNPTKSETITLMNFIRLFDTCHTPSI